jgi:ubiquinone/menaquinone biosynthesis C-methylase UbiE
MEELNNKIATAYDQENRGIPRLFARHIITVVPSITNSSIIHDNACGPAVVTSELLRALPDAKSKIEATDITAPMIEASQDLIKTHGWTNVTASIMNAGELSFENDTFTHSFTNFIVPPHPNATSETYRTLKPGGVAVFTVWKSHGFIQLMRRCFKHIFPDIPPTGMLGSPPVTEELLRAQFGKAGFRAEEIEILDHQEDMKFDSLDDINSLTEGPFGKFFTKEWKDEDVKKLPGAVKEVLTEEERETKTLNMVAWVIVARKV